jgi:NAD(P)-dependent dehydrogenase (short-subunit alcohol dehydrogenase family)
MPIVERQAAMGIAGCDCYPAAKGGVAAITRSVAVEFATQRVRVNAIAPSATMTERVRKLIAGNAALTRLADAHLNRAWLPAKRIKCIRWTAA